MLRRSVPPARRGRTMNRMPAAKGRTVVQILVALAALAAIALPAGASIPRPGQLHAPNPEALLATARDAPAPKAAATSRDTRFEIFAGSTHARFHLELQAAADASTNARFHLLTPRKTRVRGLRLPEPLLIGIELPPSRTVFRLYGDVPDRFASEGLYITEDPLGYVDGPNLYQYGLNNPVNYRDPLGLCEFSGLTCEEWWFDVVEETLAGARDDTLAGVGWVVGKTVDTVDTIAEKTGDWAGDRFRNGLGESTPLSDQQQELREQLGIENRRGAIDGMNPGTTFKEGVRETGGTIVEEGTTVGTREAIWFALGKLWERVPWFGRTGSASTATRASVDEKLERYLLNPEHPIGREKARWFKGALGFTRENADDLARQIVFDPERAVQTRTTEFGTMFEQRISIRGANGRTIDVPFVWIRNKDEVVRLVTGIPVSKP